MEIVFYPQRFERGCGSSRLRAFRIQEWLLKQGIDARIASAPFSADIIYFQKICSREHYSLTLQAQNKGIKTLFDIDDRYLCPCMTRVDWITPDTAARGEWLQQQFKIPLKLKTMWTVLDYIEKPLPSRVHKEKEILDIIFFAFPANLGNIKQCEEALEILRKKGRKFTFTYLSGDPSRQPNHPFFKSWKVRWIPWKYETYTETLRKFDLALCPQELYEKSADKLNEAITHNVAAIGSANGPGKIWAELSGNKEFVCTTTEEWVEALDKMWNADVRNAQLKRTIPWAWKYHSMDAIGKYYLKFFKEILGE